MITIISIHQKRGYSATDHLLDDRPLQDLIGREFASVADVRQLPAVQQAAAPVWIEYRVTGEIREITL